ncbi:transposase [Eubacteriales bacterium KG127]
MAKKKDVYHVKLLTEGKKDIIASLIDEYDIETADDIQDIEDWQNRPLDEIYPILFIDTVHFSVRDDNIIRKLAAYVIMGINCDGMKEVISLEICFSQGYERVCRGFKENISCS